MRIYCDWTVSFPPSLRANESQVGVYTAYFLQCIGARMAFTKCILFQGLQPIVPAILGIRAICQVFPKGERVVTCCSGQLLVLFPDNSKNRIASLALFFLCTLQRMSEYLFWKWAENTGSRFSSCPVRRALWAGLGHHLFGQLNHFVASLFWKSAAMG